MILNIAMLLIGALFLFYGIRKKLKFWMIVGAVVLCLGIVSACVDFAAPGMDGIDNHRVPFVIGQVVGK